jgi:hypothetical protein
MYGGEVACEFVFIYHEQAAMKPPTHPAQQYWPAHGVKIVD